MIIPGTELDITEAADTAMKALRRMREGLGSTNPKKRARDEMTSMLRGKNKNNSSRKVAWRHKFVCLAYRDQEKVPIADYEKEELRQAELGEKLSLKH